MRTEVLPDSEVVLADVAAEVEPTSSLSASTARGTSPRRSGLGETCTSAFASTPWGRC